MISKNYRAAWLSVFLLLTVYKADTSLAENLPVDSLKSDIDAVVIEGKENPVLPVFGQDPEDPTNNGTNSSGLLKIDRVPNFTFGKVVRSGLYQEEYAMNSNPYIQVSDLRGSLGGWALYAKISNFVSEPTTKNQKRYLLSGATLTLNKGDIQEYKSEYAAPPKSYSVSLNKDLQKVMSADQNTGQGVWASRWKSEKGINKKITLDILPNTAKVGRDYTATISWKLADIPSTEN
ncbi:hypothetical protein UAW_02998 [Enterococcus haemoperoxidus ATCC BAA-382]|uniref:WxL domain-containing protein n=1 Tax=Enterococcus haemoperoxidus ATCC BAA-382 TaxID=1158608 RepID=R2SIA1_9ENTE|nr:WxL domain-containing protein [Enterococcus haemoperoxidus]EOH92601.1 hypothetical protein UAW_02998 [Enterococcus haemoperoxidus ATCC BAA-382]EOT61700.1 hypothetical protein I583_00682 [Enterococcus haemoperoxidus ATCC BAA-382]OJG55536.1 hypothetical protein RV06_GL001979 [Enterococcus haemoperoxidus]